MITRYLLGILFISFFIGDTPLHIAVRQRCAECVNELLNNGASVDFYDRDGYTSLHVSNVYNNLYIIHDLK